MEEIVSFNRFLGMKIILLTSEEAIIYLPWKEEFVGDPQRQAVHGGVLSSLIDVCGGSACWMAITEPDTRLSTVALRADFLRKGSCEDLPYRSDAHRELCCRCVNGGIFYR